LSGLEETSDFHVLPIELGQIILKALRIPVLYLPLAAQGAAGLIAQLRQRRWLKRMREMFSMPLT
jgi:hypothetical protein